MNTLIKDLAKLAKVTDVEAFAKALQSETDTDYTLDTSNLIVRTREEEDTFKENIVTDVKKKAFNDAFEIQIKNMKKDLGLEFEGKKQEDFIKAFEKNILEKANLEPSKRIQELETTLKTNSKTLEEKNSEIESLKNNFYKEKTRLKVQGLIPNIPENVGLNKDEVVDLFFMKYDPKEDGVYSGENRLVNQTTAEPFKLEDVVSSFISERGWSNQPTGRGTSNSQKPTNTSSYSSINTLEDFDSLASEKGFNVGSQDYNALLAEVVKENPNMEL